jgi:hypothetical protein
MRAVCLAAVVALAPAPAVAQTPPHGTLPPAASAPDAPPIGGGMEVSRPLTPVEIPPVLVPPPDPDPVPPPRDEPGPRPDAVGRVEGVQQQKVARRGPLGPSWGGMELLLWWPKAAPVPPLVTATWTGTPPVLGDPDTQLLVGGRALGNPLVAGGRFGHGWSVNECETFGYELVYFFLGSRTNEATVTNVGNPRVRAVGLPFVDAVTGAEDVFVTAAPGGPNGSVFVTTTTRMQGAEFNFVANLADRKGWKLNGLVGYRFLQVHEGLTVQQMQYTSRTFGPTYDEFDGHNRFHGGQLGLHADLTRGWVFCELTGKVAFGQTFEVVRIDGATAVYTPVVGGVRRDHYAGGVYAVPSNIGRYTQGVFAVVPEATVKFGVKLGDAGRFYVGYNFLYLSDAVRPGDQIDRTVSQAHILALLPGVPVGPDRPRPLFTRSDFWAQGIVLGLETRY